MKRQVRYKTKEAIITRIDRYHRRLGEKNQAICEIDQKICSIALTGDRNQEWRIGAMVDRKTRLEANCERINRRLRRLKENLGEYLTPQLPALDNGDRSVAA